MPVGVRAAVGILIECNVHVSGKLTFALCVLLLYRSGFFSGDSGGPLVDGNGVQVGVVSFGRGCAEPGYPVSSILYDFGCHFALFIVSL